MLEAGGQRHVAGWSVRRGGGGEAKLPVDVTGAGRRWATDCPVECTIGSQPLEVGREAYQRDGVLGPSLWRGQEWI